MSQHSLDALQGVLEKKVPHHLEELRIENCYLDAQTTRELIEILYSKSYIKRVGLVKAKVNHDIMDNYICQLVLKSTHLIELDLTFNQLLPPDF